MPNTKKLTSCLLLLILPIAVLGVHAYYYYPFIADDALISLRYAQRFAAGHGLNWNTGERVEGYSNLLWVLAAAGLKWLGIELITAVRLLGAVCMSAVVCAIVYVYSPRTALETALVSIALLFFVLSAPIAVWTIGGMEQPLVAALLAWAVVLIYKSVESADRRPRKLLLSGFVLALLSITRLDGALFTVAAVVALVLVEGWSKQTVKRAISLALLPIVFVAGQMIFRLLYYGEWVPNTALVKFVPSETHARGGFRYLLDGAWPLLPLIIAAALSIAISVKQKFKQDRTIVLCCLLLFWAAYVVLIGGDIFPAWRHFVPLIVLLVMLSAIGAQWVAHFASRGTQRIVVAAAAVSLGIFGLMQFRDSENFRAKSERWEWDGRVIGTLLKNAFGSKQPLMAVDPAGCMPYWSELPSLDMLGLNDYYLPRHPPADFGQGPIAHELGDGKYVLDRQPDLVVFLLPTGNDHGYFLSGRQMQSDPRFHRDYTLVWFEGREPYVVRSKIWVRKESERIGIQRDADRISIPGFLLNGNPATITYLDDSKSLVVPASQTEPARISSLSVPPGRWQVKVDSPGNESNIKLHEQTAATQVMLPLQADGILDLSQREAATNLALEVSPADEDAIEVRRVTFVRLADR